MYGAKKIKGLDRDSWWTWRVISVITKNKLHAHRKTHLYTMKVYNTWPVTLDQPVPEKLDIFFINLKLS